MGQRYIHPTRPAKSVNTVAFGWVLLMLLLLFVVAKKASSISKYGHYHAIGATAGNYASAVKTRTPP